jgi:predicted MFS family arabinose efflux permease
VAVGAVAVTLFAARESRDETVKRAVDLPGIATISAGLTGLILALIEGNSWGWGSTRIVGLLAIAVVGLTAFVVVELRGRNPMIEFEFFRSRTFLGANSVAFIVTFAMLAQFFFIALYMQNVLGYGALETGIRFLPSTLLIIVTAPIAGRLADRIGPRPLIVAGLSLVAVAMFIQTHITVDTGYGLILPSFMVMGVGIALVMSPMSTAAMNSVSPHKAGVASGVLSMFRMVGGSFGVAVIGALFQSVARGRIDDKLGSLHLTDAQRERLTDSVASGGARHAPDGVDPAVAGQITRATRDAFVHALSSAITVSMFVAILGAGLAFALIDGKPARRPDPAREPEAAAEPLGV